LPEGTTVLAPWLPMSTRCPVDVRHLLDQGAKVLVTEGWTFKL